MHRPTDRTRWRALTLLLPLLLLPTLLLPVGARAHHGWGWASAEEFEISGVITAVRLGNPHGEVTLDVDRDALVPQGPVQLEPLAGPLGQGHDRRSSR